MRNLIGLPAVLVALLLGAQHEALAADIEPCSDGFAADLQPPQPGESRKLPEPEQMWILVSNQKTTVGCILGAADTTGIRRLYLELQDARDDQNVAVKRTQLFDRMLAQFDSIAHSVCDGGTTLCVVGRHVKAIQDARHLLDSGQPAPSTPGLRSNDWAPRMSDGSIQISNVQLQPYVLAECRPDVSSYQCRTAVEVAAKILRSAEAAFQAVIAHRLPIIQEHESFLSTRDKEWNSYFNEVSVQYPWELALNSWRFQKQVSQEDRAGFPRAPANKLIALHPSPAFEYADVGSEHSTQAAVVVELIGYERWRWREGRAARRIGASLAVSLSDVPGSDAVGYGVVVHTPVRNFSIGVVWRDGRAGDHINLVFNVDPASLIQKYKDLDVKDFLNLP